MTWLSSPDGVVIWRIVSAGVLGWMAFFFGRTLRAGSVPLIERIARIGDPNMTAPLQRYTRWLTALWAAYFFVAALLAIAAAQSPLRAGAWVWVGSAVLFVGEHGLRPLIFPGHRFPGLVQQLRDTWQVWHPAKRSPR